jgi:hypothetical protein
MKLGKQDWYLILLGFVIFALISANELGYGVFAFLPMALLAIWLMSKVFQRENP